MEQYPGTAPRLDVRRLTLAGGIWLLTLYAVSITALFLAGYPPTAGMFRFWEIFLVGFDPARASRVLFGFVEAFLYGAIGTWLFGWVYLLLPLGRPRERRSMTTDARIVRTGRTKELYSEGAGP